MAGMVIRGRDGSRSEAMARGLYIALAIGQGTEREQEKLGLRGGRNLGSGNRYG